MKANRLYDPAGYDQMYAEGQQAKADGLPAEPPGFHYSFYAIAWMDGYHGREPVNERLQFASNATA